MGGQGQQPRSAGKGGGDMSGHMHGMTMMSPNRNDDEEEFDITLDRSEGDRLGMDVDHLDEERLCIAEIEQGGLLWQWNQDHPDNPVKKGDCIIEVNQVRGDVSQLVNECTKEVVLQVKLI